jgi:hypothetical protein
MSNTPETDKYADADWWTLFRATEHCRKLERDRDEVTKQRDEARNERDKMQTELEMWLDGYIMHEIHRNELEKVEQERDSLAQALRFATAYPLSESWYKQAMEALATLKP